ncbi:MAG: hypothetical protein J7M25_09500 [Deltaproteobacteria bacterium]|nr:hypothetical protein [Deltaproteobacteria bacterium]
MRGWKKLVVAVAAVASSLLWSACGNGCSTVEPAPAPMPPSQTIEGGFQVRITPQGLDKLTSEIPGLVAAAVQNLAVPEDVLYDGAIGTLTLCRGGCPIHISIPQDGVQVKVKDVHTMVVEVSVVADTDLKFEGEPFVGSDFSCSMAMTTDAPDPLHVEADIGFLIRDEDGEIRIEVQGIHNVSVSGLNFHVHDCGWLGDVLDWFADGLNNLLDYLDSFIGSRIGDWLTNHLLLPWLQSYIDSLLPDPMGIEGQIDLGSMLSQFSPGATGNLELRIVPGGYVNLLQHGISMGVITGLNSDSDPSTRAHTAGADGVMAHSAPARCVPRFPTFDMQPFVVAGDMTNVAVRKTFALNVVQTLDGSHDTDRLVYESGPKAGQPADVGIGISQYFLDLAGFHSINSGALCLTMGTKQMSMLTVGLFSILIQSMGDLIDPDVGDAPVRLVIRPQWPIEFNIGQGTEDSPLVDMFLKDFQVDVYPFVEQRYTRALTMALDMHVGLNLDAEPNSDGTALMVVPTLLGISEDNVTVRVHNSELIEEDPKDLEDMLPGILSMVTPMLTSALGSGFPLPSLGNGMTLDSLEFRSSDNNQMLLVLASIKTSSNPVPPLPLDTLAKVVQVHVPAADVIREALHEHRSADLPSVQLNLGATVAGQTAQIDDFEWQYRVDANLWHPFAAQAQIEIRDPAFLMQGWHRIEVRARRRGAPLSVDRTPVRLNVLIDSVPPRVSLKRDGDRVVVEALDFVSPAKNLEYAVARSPGHWRTLSGDSLSLADAKAFANACGGKLGVRVTDEAGNRSEGWYDMGLWETTGSVEQGPSMSAGGCSQAGNTGGLALFLFLLGLWFVRRIRARSLVLAGALVGLLLVGATGCHDKAPGNTNTNQTCQDETDCQDLVCQDGQVADCIDGICQCISDLPLGNVGTHSSLAVVAGPAVYVAAYNRTYGDLMVARFSPPGVVPHRLYEKGGDGWEFVDGVPDGPVWIAAGTVRGGVKAHGDDVGTYTSIGANTDRQPVVAYHDKTHGSLKFAWYDGSDWHIHVVDDGGSDNPEEGDAGWYNAMSVETGNNAPGIAYMAPVIPTGNASEPYECQLRFVQADSENPTSPDQWTIYVIDNVVVPALGSDAPLGDWPRGTGLFVAMTRKTDDTPVVAYYDSLRGNLKMSEMVIDDQGLRHFSEPVIVAGEDDQGRDTGNVGVFPSVLVNGQPEVYRYAYADADLNRLYYYDSTLTEPVVVDDGYRVEKNDTTGLDMPVFHYVGWDTQLIADGDYVIIAYQDSTNQELRLASSQGQGQNWTFEVLAGDEDPFVGAYGFYTDVAVDGGDAYISSYVINEHAEPDLLGNRAVKFFVEIFKRSLWPE